jgi:general secretion pathway protein G
VRRIKYVLLSFVAGVAILGMIGPRISCPTGTARTVAARAQIAAFMVALDTYKLEVGDFPTESQGLTALRSNPGTHRWSGPYLPRDVPVDPWGMPYRYSLMGGRPRVLSLGGGASNGKGVISSADPLLFESATTGARQ